MDTPFITRNIAPMRDVFDKAWNDLTSFENNEELPMTLHYAADKFQTEEYFNFTQRAHDCALPWVRETAFESLAFMLEREVNDT